MWLRSQASFLVVGPELRPWDPSLKGGLGPRGGSSPPLDLGPESCTSGQSANWGGGVHWPVRGPLPVPRGLSYFSFRVLGAAGALFPRLFLLEGGTALNFQVLAQGEAP